MTHALDRRLARLEDQQPVENRPYAIMPERCATMEDWLAQYCGDRWMGKGHYEMLPFQPDDYIRTQRWVPDL